MHGDAKLHYVIDVINSLLALQSSCKISSLKSNTSILTSSNQKRFQCVASLCNQRHPFKLGKRQKATSASYPKGYVYAKSDTVTENVAFPIYFR